MPTTVILRALPRPPLGIARPHRCAPPRPPWNARIRVRPPRHPPSWRVFRSRAPGERHSFEWPELSLDLGCFNARPLHERASLDTRTLSSSHR